MKNLLSKNEEILHDLRSFNGLQAAIEQIQLIVNDKFEKVPKNITVLCDSLLDTLDQLSLIFRQNSEVFLQDTHHFDASSINRNLKILAETALLTLQSLPLDDTDAIISSKESVRNDDITCKNITPPRSTLKQKLTFSDKVAILSLIVSILSLLISFMPDEQLEKIIAQNNTIIEQQERQIPVTQKEDEDLSNVLDSLSDSIDLLSDEIDLLREELQSSSEIENSSSDYNTENS